MMPLTADVRRFRWHTRAHSVLRLENGRRPFLYSWARENRPVGFVVTPGRARPLAQKPHGRRGLHGAPELPMREQRETALRARRRVAEPRARARAQLAAAASPVLVNDERGRRAEHGRDAEERGAAPPERVVARARGRRCLLYTSPSPRD